MSNKKKVAIIGTVGLPANYGGFETMINYLTKEQNTVFDFTVFCQKTPKDKRLKTFNGSKLKYLPFYANGFQSIIYDITSIVVSWFKYDSLLILGTPGCIILPVLKLIKSTNTIINFGGLEWKRDKWGKLARWYLKLTEKLAVKNASIMVADNQYFCDYIKKEYNRDTVLIEYGADHSSQKQIDKNLVDKYPFLNKKYDVSVSRAQPDNNLHMVLEAYSKIPNRNIVLISNYNKFQYGIELKKRYSDFPNIYLQDAVYDLNELDVIRSNANLYIHSHSFCGTAPSLVEAMHLNLPVIAFNVPTNHQTTEEKALYFDSSDDLIKTITSLFPGQEDDLAHSMREIALRRYTWSRISTAYAELF